MLLLPGTGLLLSLNTAATASLEDVWRIRDDRHTRRMSSVNPDPNSNWDFIGLKAGEKATICDVEGPGIITHLWFTYRVRDDVYANRNVVLRMWWDDEEAPSVECPIGDFFAVGNGAYADVDSEPVQVAADGRALNCYWPMPFGKRARIEVENQGPGFVDSFYYYVDYEGLKEAPKPLATFHCQYRQEYPVVDGQDYVFAEIEGKGQYVGTVLSWWAIEDGWPGEGDDRFYIDGEKTASIQGTGTEDYFSTSWGFRVVHRGNYGVSLWDGADEGCRATAYRWHLKDPVRFKKSLRARPSSIAVGRSATGSGTATATGMTASPAPRSGIRSSRTCRSRRSRLRASACRTRSTPSSWRRIWAPWSPAGSNASPRCRRAAGGPAVRSSSSPRSRRRKPGCACPSRCPRRVAT